MATYPTNKERTNYSRLCRAIIDLSTEVLRTILDGNTKPIDLKKKLRKCKAKLNHQQWSTVNNAALVGSYKDFDITLLYEMLRILCVHDLWDTLKSQINPSQINTAVQNCPALMTQLSQDELNDVHHVGTFSSYDHCKEGLVHKLYIHLCPAQSHIIHPTKSWGDTPDPNCSTLGDDIENIRLLRNTVYGHILKTEISDADFNTYWNTLEGIMTRMDMKYNLNFKNDLDHIRICCMDEKLEQKHGDGIEHFARSEHMSTNKAGLIAKHDEIKPWKKLKPDAKVVESLPKEILFLGEDAMQVYMSALKTGKEKRYHIKLNVVGPHKAGKTTVLNQLFNLGFTEDQIESTNSVDVYNHRCAIDRNTGQWIFHGDELQYSRNYDLRAGNVLTSYLIQSNYSKENTMIQIPGHKSPHDLTSNEHIQDIQSDEGMKDINSLEDSRDGRQEYEILCNRENATTQQNAFNDETKEFFKKVVSKSASLTSKKDIADVSAWDFGGQHVFYSTHQIFLSQRGIFLLMFDIRKNPESNIKEGLPYWLRSIHTYAGGNESGIPPVILIPTHLEKLTEDREKKKRLFDLAVRCDLFDESVLEHLVDGDYSFDKNNSDLVIDQIRKQIWQIASHQADWGEEYPICWIQVEEKLSQLQQISPIISFEDLKDELCRLLVPLDENDLTVFLSYQHLLGFVIFFDNAELRKHIILKPQWLVDACKCLITDVDICKKNYKYCRKWKELYDKGILRDELIVEAWSANPENNFMEHKQHLIMVMEKLDIIAKPSVCENQCVPKINHYLVPCMLKTSLSAELITEVLQNRTTTSILCYVFEKAFLHSAFFYGLVVACLKQWSLAVHGQDQLIYNNAVVLEIDKTTCLIVLQKDHVISLQLGGPDKKILPKLQVCKTVTSFIENHLKAVTKRYRQEMKYSLKLNCGDDINDIKGLLDVTDLENNETIRCTYHIPSHTICSEDILKCWFDTQNSSNRDKGCLSMAGISQFRRPEKYIQRSRISDIKSKCSKSVGCIIGPSRPLGTAFRVGSKYVMTCWHVIEPLLKETSMITGQSTVNLDKIADPKIYIKFDYKKETDIWSTENSFNFEKITYIEENLDIAILELKGIFFPPAVTKFTSSNVDVDVHFIGHHKGEPMNEDSGVKILKRSNDLLVKIERLHKECMAKWNRDDYLSLLTGSYLKVLFHTAFSFGASGSPGMIAKDDLDEPMVVVMLQGGVPECIIEGLTPEDQKKEGIQDHHLFEFGIGMETVLQSLYKIPALESVRRDIFKE